MLTRNAYLTNLVATIITTIILCVVYAQPVSAYQTSPSYSVPVNSSFSYVSGPEFRKLTISMYDYIGDSFYVRDDNCIGGTVPLSKQVGEMFVVNSGGVTKVDSKHIFAAGHLRHGGMCQTAVLASNDMKARVVATFIVGHLGTLRKPYSSILAIYVNDRASLRFLPTFQAWAAELTKEFSRGVGSEIHPSSYVTKIYNLNCKVTGPKPRIEKCEIRDPKLAP